MSLDRKDIRAKLDPEWHEALVKICARDGIDVGEFIEREIERVLSERIHGWILDSAVMEGPGITGKLRDKPGTSGRGRR
jgi:hypothetical protein